MSYHPPKYIGARFEGEGWNERYIAYYEQVCDWCGLVYAAQRLGKSKYCSTACRVAGNRYKGRTGAAVEAARERAARNRAAEVAATIAELQEKSQDPPASMGAELTEYGWVRD